jgi:hypothetical protein
VVELPFTVVEFKLALHFRILVGPTRYSIRWQGTILVVASMILFGVGLSLFVRNPLRMPIGERFFRFAWLGPLGRAFVREAGAGVARATSAPLSLQSAIAIPARTKLDTFVTEPVDSRGGVALPDHVETDRVARLEKRVAELERWRDKR